MEKTKETFFLKLIDGERQGLVGSNGCYIPLDYQKILFDKFCTKQDWHICIVGDKMYEQDGKTVYLGDENVSFVTMYGGYERCYVFWDGMDGQYIFYGENKEFLDYDEEENSELGLIAYIEGFPEVAFSFAERKFIKSPNYERPEEEYDDYASYDDSPSIYDNPYYNDDLDMDQQSIDFWNSL